MLRPDTFALTALLAVLTAIGPLSVDLYLPSLPQIGRDLGTGAAEVQLTISFYLIGFALGQIAYGPVSDIHGRRRILLIALVIFSIATLGCALAPTIGLLIAARAVQAIGASGAVVLARAVVRDLYSGARAGRELSIMGSIMGFAPVIAPAIGGAIQTAFGWRAGFVLVCVAGLAAIVVVWRLLPETRPARAQAFSAADLVRGYGTVMRHRGFRAHLALISLSFAGLFAFISGSPFVLQDFFGLSPMAFGLAFALSAAGYIGGTFAAAHLVMRHGIGWTIGVGAGLLALGGSTMVVTTALLPAEPLGLVLPMSIYMAGIGLAMPQAIAGALQPFPDRAGTASSLAGFVQQSAAAISGAVVGHLLGGTAWPLVVAVAVCGVLTLIVWALTRAARDAKTP